MSDQAGERVLRARGRVVGTRKRQVVDMEGQEGGMVSHADEETKASARG